LHFGHCSHTLIAYKSNRFPMFVIIKDITE
jgi:hypothetical protein